HTRGRAAGPGTYNSPDEIGNGTFGLLANLFVGNTAPTGGLQPVFQSSIVPAGVTTPSARVARNGCDRIGNGLYDASAQPVFPTVEPRAVSVAGSPTFGNVTTGNIPTRCF